MDGIFLSKEAFSSLLKDCESVSKTVSLSPEALTARLWQATNAQSKIESLTFDLKYISLSRSVDPLSQRREYSFMPPQGPLDSRCQLYILIFEDLPNCAALVPPHVLAGIRTDIAHQGGGVTPLISGLPLSLQPFVVREKKLREAIDRWLSIKKSGKEYVNPTSGAPLPGYTPTLTRNPPLTPQPLHLKSSMKSIEYLWTQLDNLKMDGVDFCFNPLAPLIADFILRISRLFLRIEHKKGQCQELVKGDVTFTTLTGPQSPFSLKRQWHYLLFQPYEDRPIWYCFDRHDILSTWSEEPTLSLDFEDAKKHRYSNDQEHSDNRAGCLRDMIRHMEDTARDAIREADKVSTDSGSQTSIALEELVTSNLAQDKQRFREIQIADTLETSTPDTTNDIPTSRSGHRQSSLDWLCDAFNELFRENGSLVMFPLDYGDPSGTHMAVKHVWDSEEKAAYDENRTLPFCAFDAYATDGKERSCVILRIWDLSSNKPFTQFQFLEVRRASWARPLMKQPYLILGGLYDPDYLQGRIRQPDYLLLPSQFTKHLNGDESSDPEVGGHEGDRYFRREFPEKTFIEPFLGSKANRLSFAGSEFMTNKRSPLRYQIAFDDIYRHILELMSGEGKMRIKNPQSSDRNPEFSKAEYLTTMSKVHAAAWQYGRRFTSVQSTNER